jgi:hypothetical protein
MHGTTLPRSWFIAQLAAFDLEGMEIKHTTMFNMFVDFIAAFLEKVYSGSKAGMINYSFFTVGRQ